MDHQMQNREAAANGRRASSRLKLVLLGALAPTALFALPIGTMMFVGPSGETASVAGAGPALDCGSPRNAWRPACQTAKGNPVRDADVTGSITEGPATTGALDQKAKRRSVAGTVASAQSDPGAAKPSPAPSAQAASSAPAQKTVAQTVPEPPRIVAQAIPEPTRPEPARTEPNPPSGPEVGTWKDPVRPADLAQTSQPSAPSSPASDQPASSRGRSDAAAQDQTVKPEPAQAVAATPPAVIPTTRASEETKPDSPSPKAPVAAPVNKAPVNVAKESAPARNVKSAAAREASKPAAEEEPVHRPSRRELRRAARPTPALAVRAKPRTRIVADQSADEEPVRPVVRHRVRPVRVEEAESASRIKTAASIRRGQRRLALDRGPAVPAGLRVSSVQTYLLADGRRVVVNVQPQASVVRELAAYHAAAFQARRAAALSLSPWRGWFGDD